MIERIWLTVGGPGELAKASYVINLEIYTTQLLIKGLSKAKELCVFSELTVSVIVGEAIVILLETLSN